MFVFVFDEGLLFRLEVVLKFEVGYPPVDGVGVDVGYPPGDGFVDVGLLNDDGNNDVFGVGLLDVLGKPVEVDDGKEEVGVEEGDRVGDEGLGEIPNDEVVAGLVDVVLGLVGIPNELVLVLLVLVVLVVGIPNELVLVLLLVLVVLVVGIPNVLVLVLVVLPVGSPNELVLLVLVLVFDGIPNVL